MKRELGDDFELIKAVNSFADKKDALTKNEPSEREHSNGNDREKTNTTPSTAQNTQNVTPKIKQKPTSEIMDKPKKKKRLKVSKDKGKPKWANKRES